MIHKFNFDGDESGQVEMVITRRRKSDLRKKVWRTVGLLCILLGLWGLMTNYLTIREFLLIVTFGFADLIIALDK